MSFALPGCGKTPAEILAKDRPPARAENDSNGKEI
jgi:hypothetical protein